MVLFRKKCAYCNEKIEKGKEFLSEVKVPEFKNKSIVPFCSTEHVDFYKKFVKGIPSKNSCPHCRN